MPLQHGEKRATRKPCRTPDEPTTYPVFGVGGVVLESDGGRLLEGERAIARIDYLATAQDTEGTSEGETIRVTDLTSS